MTKVKPIPDGFHTVTPYLIVDGAKKVIDFMQQALGAKHDHEPTLRPDGSTPLSRKSRASASS